MSGRCGEKQNPYVVPDSVLVGTQITGCVREPGHEPPHRLADGYEWTVREVPSQVHLAGPTAMAGSVRRQRCAWCGALIDEKDLSNLARMIEPGEDPDAPWEPGSWEVGALVRVSGSFPRVSSVVEPERHPEHPESFRIPEDCCMALDDAVTG